MRGRHTPSHFALHDLPFRTPCPPNFQKAAMALYLVMEAKSPRISWQGQKVPLWNRDNPCIVNFRILKWDAWRVPVCPLRMTYFQITPAVTFCMVCHLYFWWILHWSEKLVRRMASTRAFLFICKFLKFLQGFLFKWPMRENCPCHDNLRPHKEVQVSLHPLPALLCKPISWWNLEPWVRRYRLSRTYPHVQTNVRIKPGTS